MLIKIDVEGAELQVLQGARAELQVLQGARHTIRSYRPVVVFEHGWGASNVHGTTPTMVRELLVDDCGLRI